MGFVLLDLQFYMYIVCFVDHCLSSFFGHCVVCSTGTRVHSVIFVISLILNIFPFSASILTFSMQNHLILSILHILIQPIFSINTIISTFIEKMGCIKMQVFIEKMGCIKMKVFIEKMGCIKMCKIYQN